MNKQSKILYLFNAGRVKRLEGNQVFAKDFFYGYFDLKKYYSCTEILEIKHKKSLLIPLLDRIIRKVVAYPISLNFLINKEFRFNIKDSKAVILVNESVMFYSIPYLIFKKF